LPNACAANPILLEPAMFLPKMQFFAHNSFAIRFMPHAKPVAMELM